MSEEDLVGRRDAGFGHRDTGDLGDRDLAASPEDLEPPGSDSSGNLGP